MAGFVLKLKPNARARALSGHPWVFANEVEALLAPEADGEVVECRDRTGRLLGTGIYNGGSQIVWRRLSRERVSLDADYLRGALARSIALREEAPCRRLVWSESDGLPGVVVDQFADALVVQVQTLAFSRREPALADILSDLLRPAEIVFRNDAPVRRLEGLPLEVHTRSGRDWEPRWMAIGGLEYRLDLQKGQKTGFYLDQLPQHLGVARHVARLCRLGRAPRVLDLFCNQGPFALQAARAGAAETLGIDSAGDAVAAARANAERNGLRAAFAVANVFDWLNDPAREREAPWDVIVLDPPPFAKKKGSLENALRGYKEINLRALQRLGRGGLLATYSCSHHLQEADFRGVVAAAANDARRKVRILDWCHQPPDHPVLPTMPESEYLRGYVLSVE